ncbi:carboxylesterase family protein, partial [Clavibacter michiganensis]
ATAVRFAPPVPHPDWTEPRAATAWAPACPQPPMEELDAVLGSFAGLAVDEDCLRVSVTMPRDVRPDDALPVMVWIHGGSYVSGAGDVPIMDPAALVAEQRVVVVTVTYRLGLLGYLGDGRDRPANLGLLDQLEALRWVARNIRAFGGDPGRVTAFGQSAGGDAVAHLLAVPEAAGLVRRAIVQSAPLGISRGRRR